MSRMNHSALRWKTASQACGGWSARPIPVIIAAASTPPPTAQVSASQARSVCRSRRSPATVTPEGSRVVPRPSPSAAATATASAAPARKDHSDQGTPTRS